MDSALEQYYSMLQELSLSKRKNSKEYNKSSALWYPLEIYKVYTSSGSFDHFITNKAKDGNLVKIINEVNQAKSPKKEVVSNKIYDEDNNVNASFEDESTLLTSLENKSKSDNTICLYHNHLRILSPHPLIYHPLALNSLLVLFGLLLLYSL